ncbi:MAG TPA: SAM-dependent methyltransferase, partial [Patescibacteria group bacterium]|nr:SAM-dependent methyltransferase [Patescibacteria group bacterium]
MTPLEKTIRERIAAEGPMDVATFMELAVSHYYATRDPFGAKGDFTTAPEVSQMFGELLGAWAVDVWMKLGRPKFQLIECGPGRGTLMMDALRAAAKAPGFLEAAQIFLVENSPLLTEKQKTLLKDYKIEWVENLNSPIIQSSSEPVILLANEFLDALPIAQKAGEEPRTIIVDRGRLKFDPPRGEITETSSVRENFVREVAKLLKARTGTALFIDYGYEGPATGDTLQAVREHHYISALDFVGEVDLTAHVDFMPLKKAGMEEGMLILGPVAQGDFLRRLGIAERADALLQNAKDMKQRGEVAAAHARLTSSSQMGRLFKVMAF